MKVNLIKQHNGYMIPSLDEDKEKLKHVKAGDIIQVEVTKKRNSKFHRKFMALVQIVFENQEKYRTVEDLLVEIKLQVGHYNEHITTGGKIIYLPKSISFANMENTDFEIFYNKSINAVLKYFLKGMEEDQLNRMVDEILRFG